MMKNIISLSIVLFFFQFSWAQNYEVDYNVTINLKIPTEAQYKLVLKNGISTYYQINIEMDESAIEGDIIRTNLKATPFFLKDYSLKKITYHQPIITKRFYIRENLPLQKWKIIDETKEIQSLKCRKATTKFRGRDYTAWFTNEISTIGGPWKFDGLPGLILEITADDGSLSIFATSIKNSTKKEIPNFEYDKNKLISWDEYCSQFREAINRIKKRAQADMDPDVEYEISIDLLEDIGL